VYPASQAVRWRRLCKIFYWSATVVQGLAFAGLLSWTSVQPGGQKQELVFGVPAISHAMFPIFMTGAIYTLVRPKPESGSGRGMLVRWGMLWGILGVLVVWSVYGVLSAVGSGMLLGFALVRVIKKHHALGQCAIGWANSVVFICYDVAKSWDSRRSSAQPRHPSQGESLQLSTPKGSSLSSLQTV
jgi:hypothetical protein